MLRRTSLFVYGSFSEGRIHHQKLEKFILSSEPAWALGSAYRLPGGVPVFCPKGHDWVPGQHVDLQAPEMLIRLLDEFHGYSPADPSRSLFLREPIEAKTVDGGMVAVEAFVYNPERLTSAAQKIPGGDWPRDQDQNPGILQALTTRQKEYILKLGGSSGRDIVPIQLDLYRELTKLDLVVDKGRRLSLTRLGQEMYRHLRWTPDIPADDDL